ncbi:OsmC family protein [Nonomuraea zeae]|uniref:OsmC family protein n=1 Tax=Nonomuraea zeae TaxID=1642303 RepID=A0A5S4GSZ6_9ACTN|nr:OsmC family protein [Nonomuraea zeae]TMR35959.1 OsmC family protein [Nonomuraea zeae]
MNGIDSRLHLELGAKLADALRVQPVSRPWTTTTTWDNGFHTVTTARAHRMDADETAEFGAGDTAPTAYEHVLAALGSCIAAGMVLQATLRGIALRHLSVEVTGGFDNLLQPGDPAAPDTAGYMALQVVGWVSAEADDEAVRDLWDRVVSGSPVANTIRRPTPVVASLRIIGPEEARGHSTS